MLLLSRYSRVTIHFAFFFSSSFSIWKINWTIYILWIILSVADDKSIKSTTNNNNDNDTTPTKTKKKHWTAYCVNTLLCLKIYITLEKNKWLNLTLLRCPFLMLNVLWHKKFLKIKESNWWIRVSLFFYFVWFFNLFVFFFVHPLSSFFTFRLR